VLFTAFFECSYGFYVRMTFESVYKAMLTTPIGAREVVLGEYLWVFVRAGMMASGVGAVLLIFGLLENKGAVFLFPLIGGILAIPCGAIGLLAAGYVRNINQFQSVYSFLIAPMFFLSGVFFPLQNSPVLHLFSQISPFYHGVRLLQMTAWGRPILLEAIWHVTMLATFATVLGLWSIRLIRRRLTT
jgi:lipooligosaccharide transport system permease protein